MRKIFAVITLAVLLIGCACERCQGQTPTPSPAINNDLIITSTEAKEFKQAIEDGWNRDPSGMANLMFMVATNSNIPTGTNTVTINNAQFNRWFAPDKGSAMSLIYWRLGNISINQKRPMRPYVINECFRLATYKISNEARRARFISQLGQIQSNSIEEY